MRAIKVRSMRSLHSYWNSQGMLATYMRRMRNNSLEIRIAGSSCRTQYYFFISSVEIDFGMECLNLLFRQRRWLTLHFDDVIIFQIILCF